MDSFYEAFGKFPLLKTPRLVLRELTLADCDAIFNTFCDEEVVKYYDVEKMNSVEEAEKLIKWWLNRFKTRKGIRWGITLAGKDKVLGTCGFSELDHTNLIGEIGCDLQRAYWGQGIMTEALQAVLQFGFGLLGLNRIETWVMVENAASIHLIKKIGMLPEGLLRQRRLWMGKYHDVEMFGLLRSDRMDQVK